MLIFLKNKSRVCIGRGTGSLEFVSECAFGRFGSQLCYSVVELVDTGVDGGEILLADASLAASMTAWSVS